MKIKNFFKKYGYFVIAGALILTVGTVVGVNGARANTQVDVPTQTTTLEFGLPMINAEVLKDYSGTELMYNQTLNQWEAHKALDLVSKSSDDVFAVLDGTVTKVDSNYEEGTLVEITHTDGIVSRYLNLDKTVAVKQGDKVTKGTKIGTVGTTAANECKDCKHLHFEMLKNGKKVDPQDYLTLTNK